MNPNIAYANADFIPNGTAYFERWAEDASAFRELEATIGRARLNQSYGNHPRERLDLFYPKSRPVGLFVFVHGGYWSALGREDMSHMAKGATESGWAVALPSYPLAPEVRIAEIARAVSRAVERASALVPRGPIHLAGHSAGGHLVLRLASENFWGRGTVRERLKKVMAISPLSDLRPLLDTNLNDDLQLNQSEAAAESPVLSRPEAGVEVTVWVGAEERPAFLDQSMWIAETWGANLHVAPGRHHFDVIDDLAEVGSPMLTALLG